MASQLKRVFPEGSASMVPTKKGRALTNALSKYIMGKAQLKSHGSALLIECSLGSSSSYPKFYISPSCQGDPTIVAEFVDPYVSPIKIGKDESCLITLYQCDLLIQISCECWAFQHADVVVNHGL